MSYLGRSVSNGSSRAAWKSRCSTIHRVSSGSCGARLLDPGGLYGHDYGHDDGHDELSRASLGAILNGAQPRGVRRVILIPGAARERWT
jgi:hypothetical protein